MALKDAHLQYEKNKEDHAALFKAWIDPKTQKRRVLSPEPLQKFKDEDVRIHQAFPRLREAISTAEKQLEQVKKRIRRELFNDEMRRSVIEYGPKPPTGSLLPSSAYWFQTTSDEERNRPPPKHTTSDSYSDLFITTDEEEQPSPLNSPESVSPPPPEEEIPHPKRHSLLHPPPASNQDFFYSHPEEGTPPPKYSLPPPPNPTPPFFLSTPEEADIPWENYMSTTENMYRHEREAQAAQAEAIQKHHELCIQLEQERQKERIFRQAVKSTKARGLKPDHSVVDRYHKSRAGVRYIESLIKDNEDHVQPKLRQKVEDIRKHLRFYHDQSHYDVANLPSRLNRSEYDKLENEVIAREREINQPKLLGRPLTKDQKLQLRQQLTWARARLAYYKRTTHLPEQDNLEWDPVQESWASK
jgi:hypothetical protein